MCFKQFVHSVARPNLDENISLKDFKEFYWLKQELLDFCKTHGISRDGGKREIADRIYFYLSTGQVPKKVEAKKNTVDPSFNWKSAKLSRETIITSSYKNGLNARNFFEREIGSHFAFNVMFMKWMKENVGKSLADAIVEWNRIYDLKKDQNYVSEIGPQFEFNRYVRAFVNDNPDCSVKDAIKFWKLKRAQRGTNEYDKKDLELE